MGLREFGEMPVHAGQVDGHAGPVGAPERHRLSVAAEATEQTHAEDLMLC
jgi:hypothetical protein